MMSSASLPKGSRSIQLTANANIIIPSSSNNRRRPGARKSIFKLLEGGGGGWNSDHKSKSKPGTFEMTGFSKAKGFKDVRIFSFLVFLLSFFFFGLYSES